MQVLIGEFSLAAGAHSPGQQWATAQVLAFSHGVGWFFWSLVIEGAEDGGDTWSLRGITRAGIELSADPKYAQYGIGVAETALLTARPAVMQFGAAAGLLSASVVVAALAAVAVLWRPNRPLLRISDDDTAECRATAYTVM